METILSSSIQTTSVPYYTNLTIFLGKMLNKQYTFYAANNWNICSLAKVKWMMKCIQSLRIWYSPIQSSWRIQNIKRFLWSRLFSISIIIIILLSIYTLLFYLCFRPNDLWPNQQCESHTTQTGTHLLWNW